MVLRSTGIEPERIPCWRKPAPRAGGIARRMREETAMSNARGKSPKAPLHSPEGATRLEHDLLGDLPVPADAYYGVHTMRAVENFPITGTPISIYGDLIRALACVKQAAALANHELGLLDKEKTDAIVRACDERSEEHTSELQSRQY